jgi:hypothetical protein
MVDGAGDRHSAGIPEPLVLADGDVVDAAAPVVASAASAASPAHGHAAMLARHVEGDHDWRARRECPGAHSFGPLVHVHDANIALVRPLQAEGQV